MPELIGCGFNPTCYISTAALSVYPYTTQAAIIGRLTGYIADLLPSTDDNNTGQIDTGILNQVITNTTTEINGAISSIYPIPLAKIGTSAIIQVTAVDSTGTVTAIKVWLTGGWAVAPSTTNAPAYVVFQDQLAYTGCQNWTWNWNPQFQLGTGLSLTVTYTTPSSVTPQTPITVNGIPVIANGGTNYQVNDVLVLTGGSSFVPDKIQNAATTLVCFELRRRRLVPNEKNVYERDAMLCKADLLALGEGKTVMDGTYRTFYSPVISWNQTSVLDANTL